MHPTILPLTTQVGQSVVILTTMPQTIVLKTGSDRPVEPVRLWTGGVCNSIYMLDRSCNQTGVNQHGSAKTGKNRWIGRFTEPDRFNTQI